MLTINKTSYKQLQKYESYFRQAYYGMYLTGMDMMTTKKIIELYEKIGGNKVINTVCNACKLSMCKEIGKVYFEYQKKMEEEQCSKD